MLIAVPLLFLFAFPGSTAADKPPEFEVAIIKPIDPKVPHMDGVDVLPGGRVVLSRFDLKALICTAFHVSYWQLSGGDPWTDETEYYVEATPPESLRSSLTNQRHTLFDIEDERLRQMLQALVIDRFQLKFHRETKTGKVFLLESTGKTPLKLHQAEDRSADRAGSIGFAGNWVLYNTTMPELANFASSYFLHCPVLDQTNLTGTFDYRSPPEDWDVYKEDQTGSFLSMIKDLGLKLKPSQGPVEVFVIDHAEKPSPN